MAANRK